MAARGRLRRHEEWASLSSRLGSRRRHLGLECRRKYHRIFPGTRRHSGQPDHDRGSYGRIRVPQERGHRSACVGKKPPFRHVWYLAGVSGATGHRYWWGYGACCAEEWGGNYRRYVCAVLWWRVLVKRGERVEAFTAAECSLLLPEAGR